MISPKTKPYVVVRWCVFHRQRITGGVLVHRSLTRARLGLISPTPRILEVIIRKNAEPGRNYSPIPDGNWRGRIWQ